MRGAGSHAPGQTGRAIVAVIAAVLSACTGAEPPVSKPPLAFDSAPAACIESASSDPRLDRPVNVAALDPALLDRAVRLHTNEARCRAGRPPLDPDRQLAAAAQIHADDMASAGFVAPTRPADPTKTLASRYRLAGVAPYRQRGEILMRLSLETPGVARVASRAEACDFADGAALVPTYRIVARRLIDAWMQTEALSTTLLAPEWTHAGAALAVRPVPGTCGEVYAAQSFVAR